MSIKRVDGKVFTKALEYVSAERASGDLQQFGEVAGADDILADLGGNRQKAGSHVHRRPNHREVEPAGAAYIAVVHVAQVKRRSKANWAVLLSLGEVDNGIGLGVTFGWDYFVRSFKLRRREKLF